MRRLLIVDARVPTPDRDGGSMRMVRLVSVFQRLGFDVGFAPSFRDSFPPFSGTLEADAAAFSRLGVDLAREPTVDDHLRAHGGLYDAVLLTGTFVASRHFAAVRRLAPQALVLFDTIDLHFLREYRAARLTGNVPRLQAAMKIKRVELALARAADATLVVSDRERQVLEAEHPPIRSWVVPIVVGAPDDHEPADAPARRDLMYLGAFTFDPNSDAMVFFVREVLPPLRLRLPNVRLRICGSDLTPEVQGLASDSVEVAGFVDPLSDAFDRARVFVAPLRYGAGVKTKVLLSMAHGLPVVASPIAAEGIPAEDGRDLLIAGDPEQWVSHITRLHEDDDLWRTLSFHGRALVASHFSAAAAETRLRAMVNAVSARRCATLLPGTPA